MFVKLANALAGFISGGFIGIFVGVILVGVLFIIIFLPICLFASKILVTEQCFTFFMLCGAKIGYILGAIIGTYLILKKKVKK